MIDYKFRKASAVWPEGFHTEMNILAGFRAIFNFKSGEVFLRIAAASKYKIFINGTLAGSGPVPSPHNYSRVDIIEINKYVVHGRNLIAIEVVGYNANSFDTIDINPYIRAEVVCNDNVIAFTSAENDSGFSANILNYKLQKVQRLSFQRCFTEYYKLDVKSQKWKTDIDHHFDLCRLSPVQDAIELPRRQQYPDFVKIYPEIISVQGRVEALKREKYWHPRFFSNIGDHLKGWSNAQVTAAVSYEVENMECFDFKMNASKFVNSKSKSIEPDTFVIYDFGASVTGLIGGLFECMQSSKIYILFSETLTDNDVVLNKYDDINNIVVYDLEPGKYNFETIEPYSLRYLKIIVKNSDCQVNDLYVYEFVNPEIKIEFRSSDDRIDSIFRASVNSFKPNSVGTLTDCANRERASWNGDAFWTESAEMYFTGNNSAATNFIENFLLPEKFNNIPDGMLPCCYPADHYDGLFVPTWAMWFIIQVCRYVDVFQDEGLKAKAKTKIDGILKYFEKFLNREMLLENLDGWVFIDWSEANSPECLRGVNYPANMLYSYCLAQAGRIYEDDKLLNLSEHIKEAVLKNSFDGLFFRDCSERKEEVLECKQIISETCQYYAFFCNIVSPSTHGELWGKLLENFSVDAQGDCYPVFRDDAVGEKLIIRAGLFLGLLLRLYLLSRYGYTSQLKRELIRYFLPMATATGTLWEHLNDRHSCCHGFNAYVGYVILKDVCGIIDVDVIKHKICLKEKLDELSYIHCVVPVGKSFLEFERNPSIKIIKKPQGWQIEFI